MTMLTTLRKHWRKVSALAAASFCVWLASVTFSLGAYYPNQSYLGVYCSSPVFVSFAACDTFAASIGGVDIIDANLGVATNYAVAAKGVVFSGGILKPASAVTLTINVSVQAGVYQIFDLSAGGGAAVRGSMLAPVYVEWWGAHSDGTSTTATRQAFQYAVDYTAASNNPSGIIYALGSNYTFDTTGVTKAQSFDCPNIIGGGVNQTTVNFNPSAEAAAFDFIGGAGTLCRGGVYKLRINGNANTIGVEFLSQGGGGFDIRMDAGKRAVLFCSCSSGGYSEFDQGTVDITTTANLATPIEYRVANSGTGSFSNSGLLDGTIINSDTSNPGTGLILIGSGSQVYNAPCNGQFNVNTGAGQVIFNNQSSNTTTCSGALRIEADSSGSVPELTNSNSLLICACTVQREIGSGAGLINGNMVFGQMVGSVGGTFQTVQAWYPLESYTSAVQYITAGTAQTTTLNEIYHPASKTEFYVLLYNGTTYNWTGTVEIAAAGVGGTYHVNTITHNLLYDTGSLGEPTLAVDGTGHLTFTFSTTITASTIRIFGVVQIPGDNQF